MCHLRTHALPEYELGQNKSAALRAEAEVDHVTRLYKLTNGQPAQIAAGKLANEDMIHNWIAERPELLGLDLLIIGREVVAPAIAVESIC